MNTDKGQCYLCPNPATTDDHIPPKGIFKKPRPDNLIKVPACEKCNNNTKLDDEYFRLVVAAASNDDPHAMEVLRQRIIPRMHRKPALVVDFLQNVRQVKTPSGPVPAVTFKPDRIQIVLNKTVRGLYLHHTGQRLDSYCVVSDFLRNPPLSERATSEASGWPLYRIGDGSVFSYRYCIVNATKFESIWLMMFYGNSLFVCDTALSGS